MFDEIDQFAISCGLRMTCYVDDMTFSGPSASKTITNEVRKIVSKYGLRSHKRHVFSARQPKVITGVCNTPTGPQVPNKLHLKIKRGFDAYSAAVTDIEKEKVLRPLLGRLEAAGQIEPKFLARARGLRQEHAKKQSAKARD